MGGDIPANSEWISLPGQAVASGADTGTVERGRRRIRTRKLGTWTYGQALPPWVKIGLSLLQG